MANESQRSRTSKEDAGITDFAGAKLLTGDAAKVHARQAPGHRIRRLL